VVWVTVSVVVYITGRVVVVVYVTVSVTVSV
jgi:hypothetical protein